MDNCCCGMPIVLRGPPKATRGKCERGHGSVNADGAGAEVFAGDGCSQGAYFGPMVAISRRGQGGRIYNNTRARVLLRRMCVKSADLTTHSPPKTSAPPPAQRHALPEHFCSPPQPRRTPTQCRRTPAGCAMHAPPPSQHLPAAPPYLPLRSASGTKKRHRTVDVRCRMSRSTVVAVGHWGW